MNQRPSSAGNGADGPQEPRRLGELLEEARLVAEKWDTGEFVVTIDDDEATHEACVPVDSWDPDDMNPTFKHPTWVRWWLARALVGLLAVALGATLLLIATGDLTADEARWLIVPLFVPSLAWVYAYYFRRT